MVFILLANPTLKLCKSAIHGGLQSFYFMMFKFVNGKERTIYLPYFTLYHNYL